MRTLPTLQQVAANLDQALMDLPSPDVADEGIDAVMRALCDLAVVGVTALVTIAVSLSHPAVEGTE